MSGFRKKTCEQAFLRIGIYGPTGSGKTFSTLLFAEGLATLSGKRIAYIDTERGTDFYVQAVPQRRVHQEAFDIDSLDTRSLTESLTAVKAIDTSVHGVVVIDSITHLWEAAIAAYSGQKAPDGSIPIQAWSEIKRPYKDLINTALNLPAHVFILGREGNEVRRDPDTEELITVGKKMRAEPDTPYEPQVLLHMDPLIKQHGQTTYRTYAQKDRSGILAGSMIVNPDFESVIAPLLPLLGATQATILDQQQVATQDSVVLAQAESDRVRYSAEKREEFEALFTLSRSQKALEEIANKLTPAVKKNMLAADITALRELYHARTRALKGERTLEPV